ncbi:MAG TPA: hypothetical protein VNW92_04600 [Polyangiaceae bacterium]|nr:hypothetical protein [Polyangiaceae bacterium]
MRDSWLQLVGSVLHPARPNLERCLREREPHLAAERRFSDERARATAHCRASIESLRAQVFAEQDGVVPARMTELEREWRALSRSDRDGRLMDLWARIAPASWIDRKRWRDSEPASQLDAALALAADVAGVEAAENALGSLRVALAAWGVAIGPRVRWRWLKQDFPRTAELLTEPLREACEALAARGVQAVVLERAQQLEREVHEAAHARFPERTVLIRALAHVAFVDFIWRAAALGERPNPVTPVRELWITGYVLSDVDASGIAVEIPSL